jgi:hypothetical protein
VKILRMDKAEIRGDELERVRIAAFAVELLDLQARIDVAVAAAHERV